MSTAMIKGAATSEADATATTTAALASVCHALAEQAKVSSRRLAVALGSAKNLWLTRSATALVARRDEILAANALDVAAAPALGLNAAAIDRLTLNSKRIQDIANSLLEVAALADPIGEVVASSRRPNGLDVRQVRVPIGVVFMIYESRPNVTVDAAALCVKSGNAVILRGGKEAIRTNAALYGILASELEPAGLPEHAVQLVATTDREAVGQLLRMAGLIDLAIPRGGESLIRRVVAEATMPVLKHYQGNCHIYVDSPCDFEMALRIIQNSKVERPGVCNAAETLLVHREIAADFLPKLAQTLVPLGVELRGDRTARSIVPEMTPAEPEDWDLEYLDKILAVGVVDSIDTAIAHITRHGSAHTDAIVTASLASTQRFVAEVDSAAVVVNASTRFNDGGQLGLGAEIGISTDKIHARGPCGLRELTSTKWIITGEGQIRL